MKTRVVYLSTVILLIICLASAHHCFAMASSGKFTDVPYEEWYTESVEYAYGHGLMNGTSETTFEPETHITRGMIVTIIYRMEGSPETGGDLKFNDVNKTYYYATPIIWATENSIVNGYDEDTFAPDDKITREQFATILFRYAKHKGLDVSANEKNYEELRGYSDCDKISEYAKDAMLWANVSKLITGVSTTTLVPQGIATRAQAATIFMRFDKFLGQLALTEESIENTESEKLVEDEKKEDDGNAGEWDDVKDKTNEDENKAEIVLPTIYVYNATDNGKYVDVVISVINNPGIASLKFDVCYDDENLKLVSVDFDSQWGNYITAPIPYKNPQTINLISPFENITIDGKLATLRFEILDESYVKNITIKCDMNNIFNSNFDDVEFDVMNGKVKKQ